jgi:hypothetical protein
MSNPAKWFTIKTVIGNKICLGRLLYGKGATWLTSSVDELDLCWSFSETGPSIYSFPAFPHNSKA